MSRLSRKSHALVALGAIVLCGGAFAPSRARATPGAADGAGPARIGDARPALELDALDGTLMTDARVAGRALIVDFFATWCEPCHRALADLVDARRASGVDVLLILVDLDERPAVVRRWAATATDVPKDAVIALDQSGVAGRRWGAHKLPTTFLVDASGQIRHINRGWGSGYRDRMARWLQDLAPPRPETQPPRRTPGSP